MEIQLVGVLFPAEMCSDFFDRHFSVCMLHLCVITEVLLSP